MSALEGLSAFQCLTCAGISWVFSVFLSTVSYRLCSSGQSSNALCEPEKPLFSHRTLQCMNSSLSNVPVNRFCLSIWNPSSGFCKNKQVSECGCPQMTQYLKSWTFVKQTFSTLEMRKQNKSSCLISLI